MGASQKSNSRLLCSSQKAKTKEGKEFYTEGTESAEGTEKIFSTVIHNFAQMFSANFIDVGNAQEYLPFQIEPEA
jgi:hypothetical protein